MVHIIKAPNKIETNLNYSVFLAGSIEQDRAEDWQKIIEQSLNDLDFVTILNPRRDKWDSSWIQSIHNPNFNEQVNWELDALEQSTIIFMYFDPKTLSPISLLEFGSLYQKNNKMIVVCPDGFWRKGNIEICCFRSGLKLYETLDDGIFELKRRLNSFLEC